MNRLQLYINISYKGYNKILEFNPWATAAEHVTDLTEALENVQYLQREKHIFYMLRYIEEGTFIVVMRTIPDSGRDHMAAWVFVPAEVEIRANDLTGIVKVVTGILSNSCISPDDASRLEQLFSRVYPTNPDRGCMVQNYGVQYAHRFYGSDTGMLLTDLIGDMRYQTAYLPYAGVILADQDDVDSIEGTDLSGRSPKRMVRMLPPDPTPGPYHPTIFNQPFEAPYLVPMGSVVEVIWTALGQDDVVQTVDVLRADIKPDCPVGDTPAAPVAEPVLIEPEQPQEAAAESTEEEPQAPEAAEEPQAEEEAPEQTQAAEEEPGEETPEQTETPKEEAAEEPPAQQPEEKPREQEKPSALPKGSMQKKVYCFETPSKSSAIGHMVHFEIQSRSPLTDSPLEGYELTAEIQEGTSRINRLVYVGEDSKRRNLMWGVAGVAVGILLTLLASLACGRDRGEAPIDAPLVGEDSVATPQAADTAARVIPSIHDLMDKAGKAEKAEATDKQADEKADLPGGAAAQDSPAPSGDAAEIAAAVRYLDSHDVWQKAQLDSLPALRGLYDDMNQYRLRMIIDKWGPKLKDSRAFTKLVNHCQGSLHLNKMEKNSVKPPYNDPSKTSIKVYAYECVVDK